MGRSTLQKLTLVCLASTTVPATSALAAAVSAAKSVGLLARQEDATCGGIANLRQCNNGFPSSFCCSSGSSCVEIENPVARAAICCPTGQDCKFIRPLSCDASVYDAAAQPASQVHIELPAAGIKLATCGRACCPPGYECQSGMCVRNADAALPEQPSASSAPPTATATTAPPAATSAPSTSDSPAASAPAVSLAPSPSSSYPARAIVAGLFPGLILGVVLTLAVVWAVKRRRASQRSAGSTPRYSGDFGPVSRNISDPIYDPKYGHRTDFLCRDASPSAASAQQSPGAGATPARTDRTSSALLKTPRVRSLFSRGTPRTPPQQMSQARGRDPYVTPTRAGERRSVSPPEPGIGRSDSTETIDVLMPAPAFLQVPPAAAAGRGVGGGMSNGDAKKSRPVTQNTTFSCLMEGAGWESEERGMVRKVSNGQQGQGRYVAYNPRKNLNNY